MLPLFDALKAFMDIGGLLTKLGTERRARLASLFDQISAVLQNFGKARAEGKPSPGLCSELRQYARSLEEIAGNTLPSGEVEGLIKELEEVCNAMQRLSADQGGSSPMYERQLDQLAEGAGVFRGHAGVLRAR